jgi:hypothetical protein
MKRSGSISRLLRVVDANFDANYLVPNMCSHWTGPHTIPNRADKTQQTLQTLQHESAVMVSSASGARQALRQGDPVDGPDAVAERSPE